MYCRLPLEDLRQVDVRPIPGAGDSILQVGGSTPEKYFDFKTAVCHFELKRQFAPSATLPHGGLRGSCSPSVPGCYVTKFASHKALKLIGPP